MSDKTHVHGGRESSGGIVLTKRRTKAGEGQRRSWRENSQNKPPIVEKLVYHLLRIGCERTQGHAAREELIRKPGGSIEKTGLTFIAASLLGEDV